MANVTVTVLEADGTTETDVVLLDVGRQGAAASKSVTLATEDLAAVGATNESAPGSDTATAGLNGRLQRVAQNLTSLVSPIGATNESAPGSDTATAGLNGRLQRIAQRISSLIGLLPTALGSASAANSLAVTASTEDIARVGATNETAASSDTATAGLNGRLQRIAQRITSLIALVPASLGSKAAASSFAVTDSTEDIARMGIVTETAPATDTASSGLNGRLQRVAQNITALTTAVTDVAHDAADSGNPVKVGYKATSSLSGLTLVADADRTNGFAGLDGVPFSRPHCNLEDIVTGAASNTDGASTEVLAAGAAGIRHCLTSIILVNMHASSVIYVEIKDGTTVKVRLPCPPGGTIFNPPVPLRGTAATAWNFDPSAATTTIYCSVIGFKTKV